MSKIRQVGPPLSDGIDWDVLEKSVRQPGPKRAPRKQETITTEGLPPDMARMFEASLERLRGPSPGMEATGVVVSRSGRFAAIDIGWREDALIDLAKEDDEELIVVGTELDVLVCDADPSGKRPVQASHTLLLCKRTKDDLMDSIGKRVAFLGKVESMIENAGYYVNVGGVRCFMPGSLAGMNKLVDFSALVGQEVYVVSINYAPDKDCIVVSHREYLKSLVPGEMAKLKEGERGSGFVTGTSHHGVFVEFNGCLTGLVPKGDLTDETRQDLVDGKIRPGDDFDFYVKEIMDNRVVLSEKPVEPSPWETVDQRYKLKQAVVGTIRSITKFGLFVTVEPKLVALLHRSYLDDGDVFEVGQEIEAIVVRIDQQARKMDLAL